MRALITTATVLLGLALVGHAQPSANGDRDNDGIPDDSDKCPDDTEDRDAFQDRDGCPEPDNDVDGVLDTADKCPLEAEDKDGYEDSDGCPDPDNDRDLILDRQDKCPNEAEIFNCVDDDDGCPDRGTIPPVKHSFEVDCDQDGFPLHRDACPAQAGPGTPNGCPAPKATIERRPLPGATAPKTDVPKTDAPKPTGVSRLDRLLRPTGYRCGPGGKLVLNKGCTCAADRVERRDAQNVSVCAPKRP